MRRSTLLRAIRVFSALVVLTGPFAAPRPASAEVIRRVEPGRAAFVPAPLVFLSANGRFIVIPENSGGICGTPVERWVPPENNDLVLYDLETSRAECINVDSAGVGVLGSHRDPSISADGQFVAFSSRANALDPRCPGNGVVEHVFLRNRLTGQTTCISTTEAGIPGHNSSHTAAISASGNGGAFGSEASNLIDGKNDAARDLVAVRLAGGVRQGSIWRVVRPQYGGGSRLGLSRDGRFVSFTALERSPTEPWLLRTEVFRRDLETGE